MKRLFVIGCSFTQYYWPTWADIIGREFDYYENWGQPGLGNRAIVERLSELVLSHKLTKDDTIIVQWSEIHRYDSHHRLSMGLNRPHVTDGWNGHGNIFTHAKYADDWVFDNWNEFSYIYHSYNLINLGKTLLESLPCKHFMFTMTDITEPAKTMPEFLRYLPIFDTMLPSMKEFTDKLGYKPLSLIDDGTHNKFEDTHPLPLAHLEYVKQYLLPRLDLNVDEQWVTTAHTLLDHIRYLSDTRNVYRAIQWSYGTHYIKGL